jgi:hypothetical protein
VEV